MLHPALVRALATAHVADRHRAGARRRAIRFAHRVANERVSPPEPPGLTRGHMGEAPDVSA